MAKQNLVWKNIEVNGMSPDVRNAFLAFVKARDAVEAVVIANARKAKWLNTGETIKFAFRGDTGFGYAKANGSTTTTVTAKDMFAD